MSGSVGSSKTNSFNSDRRLPYYISPLISAGSFISDPDTSKRISCPKLPFSNLKTYLIVITDNDGKNQLPRKKFLLLYCWHCSYISRDPRATTSTTRWVRSPRAWCPPRTTCPGSWSTESTPTWSTTPPRPTSCGSSAGNTRYTKLKISLLWQLNPFKLLNLLNLINLSKCLNPSYLPNLFNICNLLSILNILILFNIPCSTFSTCWISVNFPISTSFSSSLLSFEITSNITNL